MTNTQRLLFLLILTSSLGQPLYADIYDTIPDEELPFTTKYLTRKVYNMVQKSKADTPWQTDLFKPGNPIETDLSEEKEKPIIEVSREEKSKNKQEFILIEVNNNDFKEQPD